MINTTNKTKLLGILGTPLEHTISPEMHSFMSNKEEDQKMETDAYQDKLALGIADGIDRYFESIA